MVEGRSDASGGTRIRIGMVGGGQGAFIGAVHRIASRIDDDYELVAGALSSDPNRAIASGLELGLPRERAYGSYAEMLEGEANRDDGMEAVVIVTPNHMHAPPAIAALNAGFHVICDKPLATSVEEAEAIAAAVERSGRVFVLTHNYTGYPMIRQAKAMIAAGELGAIRLVQAEYAQDWLTERTETTGNKQAEWRTDPARSGAGGALGDIGTHAYNLACFVTGLELESLLADLSHAYAERSLDDNDHILMRFKGGARGMLWASQIAPGNENGLRLRVYGEKGGLEWAQEDPNYLWHTPLGEPKRLITRGGAGSGAEAGRVTRVPPGHPEGYLEGFANVYAEAARAIRGARTGTAVDADVVFPTVADGVDGMRFIEAAVASNAEGNVWKKV